MLKIMSAVDEESLTGVSTESRIQLLKANFEQDQKRQPVTRKISPFSSHQAKGKGNESPKDETKEFSNSKTLVLDRASMPRPSPKPVPRSPKGKEDVFERRPRSDTAPESEINDHVGKLVTLSLRELKVSKESGESCLDENAPKRTPPARPAPPRKAASQDNPSEDLMLRLIPGSEQFMKPPLSPRGVKPLTPEKPPTWDKPVTPEKTPTLDKPLTPDKPPTPDKPSSSLKKSSFKSSFHGSKPPIPKKMTKLDRPQNAWQAMVLSSPSPEEKSVGAVIVDWKHKTGPPKRPLPAGPGNLDVNSNKPLPPPRESPSPSEGKARLPGVDVNTGQNNKEGFSGEREVSTRRPAPSPRTSQTQKRETKPPPVPKTNRPTLSAAEEQSLYSYAFEPDMKLPTPEKILLKPELDSESENSDYEEPDPKAVQGMMESLRRKSIGETKNDYEAPGVSPATSLEEYQQPDEAVVKGFMDSIQSRHVKIECTPSKENLASPNGNISSPSPGRKPDMLVNRMMEVLAQLSDDSDTDEDDPKYVDPSAVSQLARISFRRASVGVLSPHAYMPEDMQDDADYVDPENLPTVPSHLRGQNAQSVEPNEDEAETEAVEESDDDDEPLYQEYAANVVENQRRYSAEDVNSKVEEEYSTGSLQRTLWSELDTVRMSGVLESLSPEERKRQEAMFEVITSEATYLRSLHILCSHFLAAPEFGIQGTVQVGDVVLDKQQSHFLFSGVNAVTKVSESLLAELRTRQEESIMITTISDIIEKYARNHFDCYVKYCSNQIFQDRTLNALVTNNPRFCEVLSRLESSPKAKSLSMHSFLMLPMQRITRMPLLIDAICHRCELGTAEFEATERALRAVNKVVKDCNEGARRLERTEEMYFLQCMLTFKTRPIPLISASRWLLRRGEVTCIREEAKGPKGTKTKSPLLKRLKGKTKEMYLFLFTDLLLVTKMKGEDNFKVIDHCSRGLLRVEDIQSQTSDTLKPGVHEASCPSKYLFSLILLENSKGKTVDYICMVETETDKLRWLEAFTPSKKGEAEGETIYEEWDCPQVQAIHSYQATQPDEISLQEGDVIKVLRKLSDGWYEGLRLRDSEQGWFPANYTEEILSEHVRARNLLQRYRLLNASDMLVSTLLKK